ncbi:hypothetical protein ACLQ8Z_23040 [Bordetella hinzii]|uniref:hypothetical protein n=1 Tax=Bordetella hinzii TaxID=103855 RepID=UPI0011547CF8|nr:hypothetical protein [Bordetella hinzii]QWF40068.1 hypothetical protein HHA25_18220 [Bordetella hinzii]QWF44614.1 hypothetical protein HHA24_18210 [Bordetella hinzii]QWF49150.1 hypothetical protein HHA23_18210 [Bordetella hinzii]QWF53686.1 hypothetical protein HHA22_18215 [Bordetella hinzii]QWF58176.1 hypothetical protein HHA21_17970 [Bordetella hinzii]
MEPTITREEAAKMGQELMAMWQLIQYSVGTSEALHVALRTVLSAIPADSPLPSQIQTALESRRKLFLLDPNSIGAVEGFVNTQRSLAEAMGEDSPVSPQTGPAGGH